jgi:hypothetical protein
MMNLSWRHFGVLAACLLVVDVHARAPELGETLGIGELLDGSFLVVSSGGRAKEVEVPRSLFFTASSMASDGRFIVGYSDRGFTVLNQNLRPVWSRPDPPYNVIALALSADGMQIAVAAADLWAARWTATTWKLFTISSSRRQRDIGRFSYTRSADELVTVNECGVKRQPSRRYGTFPYMVAGRAMDRLSHRGGTDCANECRDRRH